MEDCAKAVVFSLFNPSRPNPRRREKIKLSFYFLKKAFHEGLKSFNFYFNTILRNVPDVKG